MVDIWLPYGNTEVCVRVPSENLWDIIEPKEMAGAKDPETDIENALMNPISTKRLTETVKQGDKIAVVLKDSGVSANQMMISAILKELNFAGAKDEDITVIVAYDPLRASTTKGGDEPVLGPEISSRIRVLRHDCRNSENTYVGETSRGTKVYLNRWFTEARVRIVTGTIEPHIYAGYSGLDGVLPGISGVDTIKHSFLFTLHPNVRRGSLKGNPVHEEMVEATRLAGVNFALNIVRNRKLEVVKAFAGDIEKAFNEGVRLAEEMYKVPAERRADIVFVSPGGFPFDVNLFEACKGIDSALEVTRRGGVIVLVAECTEGYGNGEFYEFMSQFKDPDALERVLKKDFSVGGFVAYSLIRTLQKVKMYLVSIMPDYYALEVFRMKPARTANEALRYALESIGKRGKVSVIPYGNLTIPIIRENKEANDAEKK